jgi:hypothetical protein
LLHCGEFYQETAGLAVFVTWHRSRVERSHKRRSESD